MPSSIFTRESSYSFSKGIDVLDFITIISYTFFEIILNFFFTHLDYLLSLLYQKLILINSLLTLIFFSMLFGILNSLRQSIHIQIYKAKAI